MSGESQYLFTSLIVGAVGALVIRRMSRSPREKSRRAGMAAPAVSRPVDAKQEALRAAERIRSLPPTPTPPMMDARRYRIIAGRLPRPTSEQIDAFVDYVSNAHSWYKHLPWAPPGVPFVVFLDPGAGMDRVIGADGEPSVATREVQGFHHSALPTDVWRARFGFLDYCQAGATQAFTLSEGGARRSIGDNLAQVYDPDAETLLRLPPEATDCGYVRLSSLVQWWTTVEPVLLRHYVADAHTTGKSIDDLENAAPPWPEESGGRAQLLKIIERVRVLQENPEARRPMSDEQIAGRYAGPDTDALLYELLAPEHERQIAELRAACLRVSDWVEDAEKR